MNKNKNFAGFTLIELLVVIVIIGILATISVSTFSGYQEKARLAKAKAFYMQMKKSFLAKDASTEKKLLKAYYSFNTSSVDLTNPQKIIKDISSNNHMRTSSTRMNLKETNDLNLGQSLHSTGDNWTIHSDNVSGIKGNKITISYWVKNTYPNAIPVYVNHKASIRSLSGWRLQFRVHTGSIINYVYSPDNTISKDKWHYIVGSYDGEFFRLWVDGNLVAKKEQISTVANPFENENFILYPRNRIYIDEVMFFSGGYDGSNVII